MPADSSQDPSPATVEDLDGINIDEFFTGILSSLRLRGKEEFSIRSNEFDEAILEAYNELNEVAEDQGIRVRFFLKLDSIHGDSLNIRDAITRAAKKRIISLDNPEYQDLTLKMSEKEAEKHLSRLPGDEDMYQNLAKTFLENY